MGQRAGCGAVLAAAVLLTACQADPPAGRLELGGEAGESCVPVRAGHSMLIGEVVTPVAGALSITDVRLQNAHGVRVVESFVLPLEGEAAIGTSAYPPQDSEGWRARSPARGTLLAPGASYNLVVQVEPTGPDRGSAQALAVAYTAQGRPAAAVGSTRYRFARSCS